MSIDRVLVLGYYAPPAGAVARFRISNLIRSLARTGAEVNLVRPDSAAWRDEFSTEDFPSGDPELRRLNVIETPHPLAFLAPGRLRHPATDFSRYARAAVSRFRRMAAVEEEVGWSRGLRKELDQLARRRPQLIVVSCGPFSPATIAHELARRCKAPLWLDYRDPLTDNPHIPLRYRRKTASKEREHLRHASIVTTVSPSHARLLKEKVPRDSDKVHVLWNGHRSSAAHQRPAPTKEQPTLVYAGRFYRGSREISPVFRWLRSAMNSRPELEASAWRFLYLGPSVRYVRECADRHGITDRVETPGVVSHETALDHERRASVSLCIASTSNNPSTYEDGNVTSKFFELLAARCRVAVIAPRSHDLRSFGSTIPSIRYAAPNDDAQGIALISDAIADEIDAATPAEECSWESQQVNFIAPLLESLPQD